MASSSGIHDVDSTSDPLPIEVQALPDQPLGMSPAAFLRDYWQKRPLLIRNALRELRGDATPPIEPDDLAGLACEDYAISRLIIHHDDSDSWQVRHGPLKESEFDNLPERDWTLLVQDVDRWDRDVAGLLGHFNFLPRWRIDDIMVSFAAPGGSVGAHVDHYDVFLAQSLGARRWQIDCSPSPDLTTRDGLELKLLHQFKPTHDWLVQPGDMLYLPPGIPHYGVAVDSCLTFSIGMRAPSHAEMLVDLADHLAESLPDVQRYADPDLLPTVDAFEIDNAALARVRAALPVVGDLSDNEWVSWFGCFLTRYRSAGDVAPAEIRSDAGQLQQWLDRGASLQRHPLARAAWTAIGPQPLLFVDGQAHACSAASASLICNHEQMGCELVAQLDEAARTLLLTLLDGGHLVLLHPGDAHTEGEDGAET